MTTSDNNGLVSLVWRHSKLVHPLNRDMLQGDVMGLRRSKGESIYSIRIQYRWKKPYFNVSSTSWPCQCPHSSASENRRAQTPENRGLFAMLGNTNNMSWECGYLLSPLTTYFSQFCLFINVKIGSDFKLESGSCFFLIMFLNLHHCPLSSCSKNLHQLVK